MNRILILLFVFITFITFVSCDSEAQDEQFSRAMQSYLQGQYDLAFLQSSQLYEKNPKHRKNSGLYAKLLIQKGDDAESQGILEDLRALGPLSIDQVLDLSRIYFKQEQWEQTEMLVQEVLEYSSKDPRLLCILARCQIQNENYKEALGLLDTAAVIVEQNVEIFLLKAELYERCGFYEESQAELTIALSRLGEDHPLKEAVSNLLLKAQKKAASP